MQPYKIRKPQWEFIGADGIRMAYGQERNHDSFGNYDLCLNLMTADSMIGAQTVAIGTCAAHLTNYRDGIASTETMQQARQTEAMQSAWRYMFGPVAAPIISRKLPSGTIAATPICFADLAIGQAFDWIDDTPGAQNSFFPQCRKVSARGYIAPFLANGGADHVYRVGTIRARVFHVQPMESK